MWPLPLPLRWASASKAVSVPESASTWWAERTVPSATGVVSAITARGRDEHAPQTGASQGLAGGSSGAGRARRGCGGRSAPCESLPIEADSPEAAAHLPASGPMRYALMSVAAVALVVVVVIGLTQASRNAPPQASGGRFDLMAAQRRLARAPEPLRSLYG